MLKEIINQRERVIQALGMLRIKVWPSRANFILFQVDDARRSYQELLDRGIRVRDVSSLPGLGKHLRVTIGTKHQNDLFLNAMAEMYAAG